MRRSETYVLAMVVAVIHALLLATLIVLAWRSPFMLIRLPEKPPPVQAAQSPM